uniref:Retrotransposon protein, putative, unclassified n=1 Tax=Oryza sativa subsp. japonica TaxID=39947 RepID=Q2QPR3_ORYSJ|nr:retrotransposon protein, putative, unclassified [Oryza sativa Japonica Group]
MFRDGKEYCASVGKAWKRGYLLCGPPGTGKSNMIAALANFLEYNVYDLERGGLGEAAVGPRWRQSGQGNCYPVIAAYPTGKWYIGISVRLQILFVTVRITNNGHGEEYQYINDLADRIAKIIEEHFGIKPKQHIYVYRLPYPKWFDRVPLPHRYKVPDFSKFLGQNGTSTMEHFSQFLVLRVNFFPLSLTGSTFTWFSSLPSNSISGWADLEKKFHEYFFAGIIEMKFSDLISVQ